MRTPPLSPAEASLNLPLPRPPAWIWLFTTQTGPGSCLAAASESEAFKTATPREIGTPNSCSNALAWYSWIFIWTLPKNPVRRVLQFTGIGSWHTIYQWNCNPKMTSARFRAESRAKSTSEQVGRDFLAGVDQALNCAHRLVEGLAVLTAQFDL